MLQAQSVFILGIYEGEYSPPQKKYQVFWYFGPEFSIVTKSQWLIQGDASLPAPTVHRNWPFWGPKLEKKTSPTPTRLGFDHIPLRHCKKLQIVIMN